MGDAETEARTLNLMLHRGTAVEPLNNSGLLRSRNALSVIRNLDAGGAIHESDLDFNR